MNLNFFYAKHKHRMWKMHLKGYLLGLNSFDEQQIVSPDNCELGKWINNVAVKEYKHIPDLQTVVNLHLQVHELVKEIPVLNKNNQIADARKKLEELEKTSDKLIEGLQALETKVLKQKEIKP